MYVCTGNILLNKLLKICYKVIVSNMNIIFKMCKWFVCGVSEKYLLVLTFVLPLGFRKNIPKNNTRITNFRRQQKKNYCD